MNFERPSTIRQGYAFLVHWANKLQSPFLLLIRLYWGWGFFQAGWGKLFGQGPAKVAEFFASINIPLPLLSAWMASLTECVGGLLLIVGFASRLISLPLIFTMLVAYLTADLEAVQAIFSDPDKFTGATPFLFLFACLIVLIFGPGVFSVDYLLARKTDDGGRSR